MGNRKFENEKIFSLPKYWSITLQTSPEEGCVKQMSFFDSEVVRAEMVEIGELQEDVYKNVFNFASMDKEEKLFHVGMLERLLDKQKILYTRLSLSDDAEAQEMKERILESAVMMGLPKGTDMNMVFNNMSKMLEVMKDQIDKSGSDL